MTEGLSETKSAEEILLQQFGCKKKYDLMKEHFIPLTVINGLLEAMGIYAAQFKSPSVVEQWISVTERLPDGGGYYLTVKEGYTPDVSTFFDGEWFDPHDRSIIEPTHWQPLPEPPRKSQPL